MSYAGSPVAGRSQREKDRRIRARDVIPRHGMTMRCQQTLELSRVDGRRGRINQQDGIEWQRIGLSFCACFVRAERPSHDQFADSRILKCSLQHEAAERMANKKDVTAREKALRYPRTSHDCARECRSARKMFRHTFAIEIRECFQKFVEPGKARSLA